MTTVLFRCAAISLLVGATALAQQQDADKPKIEIPDVRLKDASMPKCLYCPNPEYSSEARQKKIEGVVVLMVVITREGKATNIQVTKSPGLGLSEKAIEGVRKWRFKPAMYKGRPVPVQVPVEVTFRLNAGKNR